MPLTTKGNKVLAELIEQYGEKKGKQVFFALKNKGKLKDVDPESVTASGGEVSNTPHLDKIMLSSSSAAQQPRGKGGLWVSGGGSARQTSSDRQRTLPDGSPNKGSAGKRVGDALSKESSASAMRSAKKAAPTRLPEATKISKAQIKKLSDEDLVKVNTSVNSQWHS